MCLYADYDKSQEYLQNWPEGEKRTFYKVLRVTPLGELRAPFYNMTYTPGTTISAGIPRGAYNANPNRKISSTFIVSEGIHVAVSKEIALILFENITSNNNLQHTIVKVTAEKKDFIGCDYLGNAAFYDIYLSETALANALAFE